ncbi:MAG: potassium channel family protein, partial [Actinomycetota bacterium]|nr:potassium channel family protein [Actinomycetota bacterium]
MGSERLEAFSDAVMAVIMTIMAFDLRAPTGATLSALQERFPGLLVYILSFAFVGIYWNNHHHLLRATKKISGAVMWSNLFLLLWLSLMPVATKWVRDFPLKPFPAAAYGVVGLGAGFAYSLLVRAIIRVNG